jgi:hypothetical protein
MGRARVRLTLNFDRNLDQIEKFLGTDTRAFTEVLDWLFGVLIPELERFPKLGVDFIARRTKSVKARSVRRHVLSLMTRGDELRELISGKYLVLYLYRQATVYLLSIRHHRQLSFDLAGHWADDVR